MLKTLMLVFPLTLLGQVSVIPDPFPPGSGLTATKSGGGGSSPAIGGAVTGGVNGNPLIIGAGANAGKLEQTTATGATAQTYADSASLTQVGILATIAGEVGPLSAYGPFVAAGTGAGNGTNVFLDVYDISNAALPARVSRITLNNSVNGSNGSWCTFVFGRFAYLCTPFVNSAGRWQTWDISNLASPVFVSSITDPAASVGGFYDAQIVDSTAYLLSEFEGCPSGTNTLYAYDITNRASPNLLGTVTINGWGGGSGLPHELIVRNGYAYMSILPTDNSQPIVQIADIHDPINMTITSSIVVADGNAFNGDTIALDGNYLYVFGFPNTTGTCVPTTGINCTLRIFNIKDPTAPAFVTGMYDFTATSQAADILLANKHLYLGFFNSIAGTTCPAQCEIQVLDVSNPAAPVAVAGFDLGANSVRGMALTGKNLVVTDSAFNLRVFETPGLSIPSASIDEIRANHIIVDQDFRAEGVGFFGTGGKFGPLGVGSQGPVSGTSYRAPNCTSSASPAVCSSLPTGAVVIATGQTSVVVDTTAVTANSDIAVHFDSSLGTRLGVTCNTAPATVGALSISARTPGTSFTISVSGTVGVNPACLTYSIWN